MEELLKPSEPILVTLSHLSLNLVNVLTQQSSISGRKKSITLRLCLLTLIGRLDLDFSSFLFIRMTLRATFRKAASLNITNNMSDTLVRLFESSIAAPSIYVKLLTI